MKRFTVLLSIVGVLAFWAVFQALSEARAEAKSASIPPVYDSTGAMLNATRLKAVMYEAVLGKSLEDENIADFVSSSCSSVNQFQLCRNAGMALWIGPTQNVDTVYLYTAGANGFAAYEGEMPFGIDANDSMADVEQKLGQPKVVHAPQAGWEPGLPDEGRSPDHIHYWAIYKRLGVTIVYNTPFANDKSATIQAIVVNK